MAPRFCPTDPCKLYKSKSKARETRPIVTRGHNSQAPTDALHTFPLIPTAPRTAIRAPYNLLKERAQRVVISYPLEGLYPALATRVFITVPLLSQPFVVVFF